ncbi:MAG: M64 family metallo-endopeptidase [Bacteroidetes bacterium]|nr:M64 family metallo-endopeptidase [Bacteroidota bacterium]
MKKIIFILLFISYLNGFSQYNRYFEDRCLRIDYFHSGNIEHEYFRPDELIEKTIWAGSKINLIDTFNYGKIRVMVYEKLTSKLIYSRTYSSLFEEWRTTTEGKGSCGNFSETVLIPFPKVVVNVVFQSRDSLNKWHDIASQIINTKKDFILKPKTSPSEINELHHGGNVNEKLDIAIIADGYTMADLEKMKTDFQTLKNAILKSKPYEKNADKINIWGVMAISKQSGVTNPSDSFYVKSAVGCSFNTINSDRYLMTMENKLLHDQLANAAYDQIIIMCNTNKYGGGGIYNFYSTVAAGNPQVNYLIEHEFGHAFAGLADEYYTSSVTVENFYPLNIEPWEPNITTLIGFDKKWKNMLDSTTVVPTPDSKENNNVIGVYEGGGYMKKGVYRPYIDCTMKSIHYDALCPVCLRATQWMIDFYAR